MISEFLDDDDNCNDQQSSQVYYMELVDENPDSDETMSLIAEELLDKFGSETQDGWVVLVGDGKTYQHLMNIKRQYGTALHKLLIFPGDWHTLKNFQPVLMKVYYSAGLRELAKSCGHRGATLKSLQSCTHFKRTHCFLLQAWEALYRQMLKAYFNHNSDQNLLETVKCILSSGIHENRLPGKVMERIEALLEDAETHPNFMKYIQQMAQADDTWKFWVQFVFSDCYSYIGLYWAIRGSNWKLRLSSLKNMAPFFAAFDRDTYERIVPNHLADLQQYPNKF